MLFALLSWNAGHHWDEYFYLYSSFMHSPAELLRYELQTAIFPPGFFTEKIGHVALLHVLTHLFGAGERVLYGIEVAYALLLVAYFWASYRLLLELFDPPEARETTLVLMFTPLSLYLGYKLLSETPSLLVITLACWSFVRSFTSAGAFPRRIALFSAIPLLTLAALFRVTGLIAFLGMAAALLVTGDFRFPRRRLLERLALCGLPAAALYGLALSALGGNPFSIFSGVHTVATTHPVVERAFALICFVQTFVVLLPFAWWQRREPAVRLALVWLACSGLPFLIGHEPRYYAFALLPFAMLSAAGLRAASGRLAGVAPGFAWVGLLALLVLLNRLLLIPLMPYEVEQEELLSLFHLLQDQGPQATFLLPWISDYSLLRFSSPRSRIVLCLSLLPGGRVSSPGYTGPLESADRWWAGPDHYVGSEESLLQQPRPWKYIGWTYNPALSRLLHLLSHFGVGPPREGKLHNHLTQSWIWSDSSLSVTLAQRHAQYYVYDVGVRSPEGALGQPPAGVR